MLPPYAIYEQVKDVTSYKVLNSLVSEKDLNVLRAKCKAVKCKPSLVTPFGQINECFAGIQVEILHGCRDFSTEP